MWISEIECSADTREHFLRIDLITLLSLLFSSNPFVEARTWKTRLFRRIVPEWNRRGRKTLRKTFGSPYVEEEIARFPARTSSSHSKVHAKFLKETLRSAKMTEERERGVGKEKERSSLSENSRS
jgi:hypothetical protein